MREREALAHLPWALGAKEREGCYTKLPGPRDSFRTFKVPLVPGADTASAPFFPDLLPKRLSLTTPGGGARDPQRSGFSARPPPAASTPQRSLPELRLPKRGSGRGSRGVRAARCEVGEAGMEGHGRVPLTIALSENLSGPQSFCHPKGQRKP